MPSPSVRRPSIRGIPRYKTAQLLDEMAKKNGCTLCGSGYQEVFWGNLIATLAGATHTITKIVGKSSYNVEEYGIALAKVHGAGLSLADFDKQIAADHKMSAAEQKALIEQEAFLPSYMWSSNGWLCARLGLTVKEQTQRCVPQTHDKELRSETLQMTIPAGHATGMSAVVSRPSRRKGSSSRPSASARSTPQVSSIRMSGRFMESRTPRSSSTGRQPSN